MRGGLHQAIIVAALALGGCAQMTRHSNMMIFGTNTVVGLRVGVNATSVPEIALGYARQEAVVMPLVANVSPATGGGTALARATSADRLVPCDMTVAPSMPKADDRPYLIHPCSLVGINGRILDSYSVLASFGGNFKAAAEGTNPKTEASGGVAQYFATGIAAQTLALNGGAAVVAGGPAATKAASNPPLTIEGVTITPYQATDPAALTLQNYLSIKDQTAANHRAGLAMKAQAAFGNPSSPMDLKDLVIGNDSKGQQALLAALLVLETDPAGLAVLKDR